MESDLITAPERRMNIRQPLEVESSQRTAIEILSGHILHVGTYSGLVFMRGSRE